MRRFVAIAGLLGAACALPEEYVRSNGPLLWKNFKDTHGKSYSAEEEAVRYNVFMGNMIEASQLEKQHPHAQFGASKFADLSKSEFKQYHNLKIGARQEAPETSVTASSVDWRSKGAVTQVKDQGQCGSCWAFSSTGGIEGAWQTAGNSLTSVSEQELVSCDKVDDGCNGGLMDNAFSWLQSKHSGAIVTESAYKYTSGTGRTGTCKSVSAMKVGSTISGFKDVSHSESAMVTQIQKGPISIAVDAESGWQTYTGGILSSCSGKQLDHGVLAVGLEAGKYWIVKNSWGSSWGESGYIRLEYGSKQCGLNLSPVVPTVAAAGNYTA